MGAVREERVEFERRIELLNNELNRELSEHKAFIEKTAIEVGRLKAEKERAVKEFVEKLKKKVHNYYLSIDSYCTSRHVILVKDIDELLKEYENE